MKVILKDALIVLIPQTEDEATHLARWKAAHVGHVLLARPDQESEWQPLELHDLGERIEACREPINVVSNSADPVARTISNLASTPFELDGRRYRSVESFWQGLKYPLDADRLRIADCEGPRARSEGSRQGYGRIIAYGGAEITVGTYDHWQLMERACRAKFMQNAEARSALLTTGERPLVHIVRRDSRSIPGVIMAQIWMRIRRRLRERASEPASA
ncbi:MAG: NADAR family protein [Candidatus Contendobacter sp.]|nr:NADAR family protein [Candidatus Contendobacter sp.]MDG4558182.1 NADAR family protein [Candidatus Contendobacter sp.]